MKKKFFLGIMTACILGTVAVTATVSQADNLTYKLGDCNDDGCIDPNDASLVLAAYAKTSSSKDAGLTDLQFKTADVNHDNRVDAVDASGILAYYAYISTNGTISIEDFINKPATTTTTTSKSTTTTSKPTTTTTSAKSTTSTSKLTTSTTSTTTNTPLTTTSIETIDEKIKLNGSSINVEGKYAVANGSKVTISHSGTYTIEGTLDDGQILVDIPDNTADPDTVKLVLNGANITGKSAPAILVNNADKTSVTIADGTENTIFDSETAYSGDFATSAVIEAKDDLTFKGGDKGTGVLNITANIQPAVVCNNDIKITGGNINIKTNNKTDANDAVKGKTSVVVKGGKLDINAEGDGINSSKGNVDIEGGEVNIKSGKDAIQAETSIKISGGNVGAFGDRGLTCAGTIDIAGGNLVATAYDNQCENLTSTSQTAMKLDFTKEWSKNNPIAVTDASKNVILEMNTFKKYKYAIVSSSDFDSTSDYKVFAGGIKMKHSTADTFKGGSPASYTDVNNDMENEELLYGELFDQNKIHSVDIKMSEEEWNDLLKNAVKEEWHPCDVIIDGEEYKNVGIRTKGNSSLVLVQNGKYSFRFKLDKYDKYTNYHGLTEFCINSMHLDPSCMRDTLCYNAMNEIDGLAPLTAHSDVSLNGKPYSFYMITEQPGTTLAERYAIDDDSNLYKATERSYQDGENFNGFGTVNSYSTFTEDMPLNNLDLKFGNDKDLVHLEELKTAINKMTPSNYKFIEDIMDVPSFLKGFAVNTVMCNYDSYNGTLAHNYYLMYTGGKHYFVGWDYNLCLGNFINGETSVTSDVRTGLYQATVDTRPFVKLIQIPEYYNMYIGYVNEIVKYYNDPEKYISNYADKIRSHIESDPLSDVTVEQFNSCTSKSANGLQLNNTSVIDLSKIDLSQFSLDDIDMSNFDINNFDITKIDLSNIDMSNFDPSMFTSNPDNNNTTSGNGGLFGQNNLSIVDFLIKRIEVINASLKSE